ncbi:hypothetical protein NWE55_11640 [Myroides albus]|uniref:Uncharacterized protein n=1 Tax=Myroides albus TaxID=2562892 RepID=A0A6I3LJD4_9FLAO|nr:hypothetical protein [Myroides albus]MTG97686.1 hypothetical protein [Myroides albus]UVD78768.1 hypothetical protein NWE55_11640 [Myroides albus]
MSILYKLSVIAFIVSSCSGKVGLSAKSNDYKTAYKKSVEVYDKDVSSEIYNREISPIMTGEGKILSPYRTLPQQ